MTAAPQPTLAELCADVAAGLIPASAAAIAAFYKINLGASEWLVQRYRARHHIPPMGSGRVLSPDTARVLAALTSGEPMHRDELAIVVGIDRRVVDEMFRRLRVHKRIVRTAPRTWAITDSGRRALQRYNTHHGVIK